MDSQRKANSGQNVFVLCPVCDGDALAVVKSVFPLTSVERHHFVPIAPTKIAPGGPIESGCCGAALVERSRAGKIEFLAMRTAEGYNKW